jgi:hypothetical protein
MAQEKLRRATISGGDIMSAKQELDELMAFEQARNTPGAPLPDYLRRAGTPKAQYSPGAPLPDYLRRAGAPVAANVPTEVSVPDPVSNRPGPLPSPTGGAPRSSGAGGYAVTSGGIASFDPNQAIAGSAPSGGQAPAAGGTGRSGQYGSKAEAEYAALLENRDSFKLPEALNYEEFIQAAGAEEAAIREEAKKQAIGAALVQLGAGLAAGDMAKGFTTAGAESRDILSQGRREASAQKALAQQFKLQGMEGARDQAIKQQDIELRRAQGAAEFQGGMRKERQDQENENRRIAMEGARISASLQEARVRGQINERDFIRGLATSEPFLRRN